MSPRTLSLPQVVGLIAVIVILVFGVTYASLYLPGLLKPESTASKADNTPKLQLILGDPEDSEQKAKVIPEMESGPGHRTFWFRNPNDKPVQVALYDVNCTCSSVKLAVAPRAWGPDLKSKDLDARENDPALVWEDVPKSNTPNRVTVPPQSRGGVQLHWKKDKPKPTELFRAELHTEMEEIAGAPLRIETEVNFIDAVRIATEDDLTKPLPSNEVVVGTLGPGDVVGPINVILFSSTRSEFTLTVEEDPKNPCIVWGQPQKLTPEQCKALADKNKVKVLAAYQVPVTVYERAPTGQQLDVGPFRRALTLNSDAMTERIILRVSGAIRGDVIIGSGDDRDQISFGQVEAAGPRSRPITLISGTPGLKLELDPDAKLPDYLKATITEDSAAQAGPLGKSWTLTVTLLTDKVLGPLPRDESLIVLKTNSDPPRKIRIPVLGTVYVKR